MIGVGFSSNKASLEKLPGWEPESWAYHGDDGKTFCCQSTGKTYGPKFTSGDIVGCGINFTNRSAFFTKNGVFQGIDCTVETSCTLAKLISLGIAFRDLKDISVYPSIGMKRPQAHLRVNFGQRPFTFDIDNMVKVSYLVRFGGFGTNARIGREREGGSRNPIHSVLSFTPGS